MKRKYLRIEPIQKSEDLILIDEIDVFIGVISDVDFYSFCGETKEVRNFDDYEFWNTYIDEIKKCLK